jgi:hypothetical protein
VHPYVFHACPFVLIFGGVVFLHHISVQCRLCPNWKPIWKFPMVFYVSHARRFVCSDAFFLGWRSIYGDQASALNHDTAAFRSVCDNALISPSSAYAAASNTEQLSCRLAANPHRCHTF